MARFAFWQVVLAGVLCFVIGGCDSGQDRPEPQRTTIQAQGTTAISVARIDSRTRARSRNTSATDATAGKRPAEPSTRAVATGRVLLADDAPVSDALVTLWTQSLDPETTMPWYRLSSTLTDAKGQYKLSGTAEGKIGVTARKKGYAVTAHEDNRRLLSRDPKERYYPAILKLRSGVTVSGHVEGAQDSDASTNIMLRPNGAPELILSELNTFASHNGAFKFDDVPAGPGSLVAVAPERSRYSGAYTDNETISIPPLKPAYPVAGALVLEKGNFDFSGNTMTLLLRLDSWTLPTTIVRASVNKDGAFSIPWVEEGTHRFSLESTPDYLELVDSYRRIQVNPAKDNTATTVTVRAGHTVTGVVCAADTSAPLAGVKIYRNTTAWHAGEHQAVSTANGEFVVEGVTDSNVIFAQSDTHHRPFKDVQTGRLSADTTSVEIRLKRIPYVRGYVTANGALPADLTVVHFAAERHTHAGKPINVQPDGSFEVPVITNLITIAAQAPGFAPVFSDAITLEETDLNGLELKLGQGQTVTGEVVSRAGQPVAGARVSVFSADPKGVGQRVEYKESGEYQVGCILAETTSDATGHFVIPGVTDRVRVRMLSVHPAYPYPAERNFTPVKAEDNPVRFVMEDCTSTTLYITDEDDRPVSGVEVRVEMEVGVPKQSFSQHCHATGTVVLERLPIHTTSTLNVYRKGYVGYERQIRFTGDPIHIRLKKQVLVEATIRCIDAMTNEPVEATVHPYGKTEFSLQKVSGKVGVFTASKLIPGIAHDIEAESNGYGYTFTSFVPRLNEDNLLTVLMRKPGSLTGRVVDGKSGLGINAAGIYTGSNTRTSDKPTTVTDSRGYFWLSAEKGQFYNLRAKVGNDKRSEELAIPNFSSMELDLGDIPVFGKAPAQVLVIDGSGAGVAGIYTVVGAKGDELKNLNQGLTDKSGKFQFEAFPDDVIKAAILKQGTKFPEMQDEEDILQAKLLGPSGTAISERTIVLTQGSGSIAGNLLHDGRPKSGSVQIKPLSQAIEFLASSSVGLDGKFAFKDLPPGLYELKAEGFDTPTDLTATIEVNVPTDAGHVNQDIHLKEERNALRVNVFNEAGERVEAAQVSVRNEQGEVIESTNTNSNGYGGMWINQTGNFRVSAFHCNYGVSLSKGVTITAGVRTETVDLKLVAKDGQVDCTVLSFIDGLPLVHASGRMVSDDGQTFVSGEQGATRGDLVFRNLPPGPYKMIIECMGFETCNREVTIASGDRLELSEVLMPGGSLTVKVTDDRGQYVQGAVVTLQPGNFSSTTKVSGDAEFSSLTPADYSGIATGINGKSAKFNISTRNQQRLKLEVMLK